METQRSPQNKQNEFLKKDIDNKHIKRITRTSGPAQGTLLSAMRQPGREGGGGEGKHARGQLSPFGVHLKLSQRC